MPRIDEFPVEPKYTIKKVCAQTGIRPVTLRAWERRYEVLNPSRMDNHYRLYSERDVAVLRWVKERVEGGISISNAVQELRSMQAKGVWPEAIPEKIPETTRNGAAQPAEYYARQLYQAFIRHDEVRAAELMYEAQAGYELMDLCMDVISPALVEIGEAWYRGEISVTTEHFASAFVRGKLLAVLQGYPMRHSAPFVLVGCAPAEHHEIGSLMIAALLRGSGYKVEYLGPDLPIDDLVEYAHYEHPAIVILSATTESPAQGLANLQEKLNRQKSTPIFGYGGRVFNLKPEYREKTPGVFLGATLRDSVDKVKRLVGPAK